ncbi:acetoin utilization protein AcuA [Aneurinibacillus soli]|uniref:Acetoin utilization protein AcuA n=1 Tax=Aneurinibacillus soli TaxID=1500254 RepID=A0A0U4NKT8_9BACL|nr:GNAT family N-acetyltransferase [Aneurinibacillus soli]PYE59683.1 acetoin utilization protein AcuA [Aneurinibacillus soli]BAU29316.1 Acetoin utilization protein AcuA [Aneurinibacillus soli]
MKHDKTYYELICKKPSGMLTLEGPVTSERILSLSMDEGLKAFRRPHEQQKALAKIAALPEGRIILAVSEGIIIGYVTFLYPDPMERWSQANMDNLLELGAIEVSPRFRKQHVGEDMLALAFRDDAMDDYIVFTTEYYWHWDLKGTGLDVWDYRKIMEKVMASIGLQWFATDDPEICSHPANCMMARIGSRISLDSMEAFDRIRFQNRAMY